MYPQTELSCVCDCKVPVCEASDGGNFNIHINVEHLNMCASSMLLVQPIQRPEEIFEAGDLTQTSRNVHVCCLKATRTSVGETFSLLAYGIQKPEG